MFSSKNYNNFDNTNMKPNDFSNLVLKFKVFLTPFFYFKRRRETTKKHWSIGSLPLPLKN